LRPRCVEEIKIQPGPLKVLAVGRVYPRKNYELFNKVKKVVKLRFGASFHFSVKWDYTPLPEAEYIKRLDACDIYLVTSYQEGGPIPAMDAMLRGGLSCLLPSVKCWN
jgi:glycosyltransferase involved in cell wall biosynthesis